MATEQYFQQVSGRDEDESSLQRCKPPSKLDKPGSGSDINLTGGFDCNICLDLVHDPVVTLCGHLYCWPCIYKWIRFQSDPTQNPGVKNPQCPVCKDEVSQETLVPLYGRGQTKPKKAPHLGLVIPRRPPSPRCGFNTLLASPTTASASPRPAQSHLSRVGYNSTDSMPMLNLGGAVANPTVGMFGEMVYARIFGTTLYSYPNTYDLAGINSPRVRRHVMEADKSLSRVCFFLCCSLIVCLLLF